MDSRLTLRLAQPQSTIELRRDVRNFVQNEAPFLKEQERKVELAAIIAKNARLYDPDSQEDSLDDIQELTAEERDALRAEKTDPFAQKKILAVFIAVSLAALLQGFVQSSQNGANLFERWWGIRNKDEQVHQLGITNAAVYWAAAIIGINVFAFYSGDIFRTLGSQGNNEIKVAMLFSFAFGVVNFGFGLFAFKTIDSWGRRKLLLSTLPFMSLCLVITAICFARIEEQTIRLATVATFLLAFRSHTVKQ
ncbi:hypothetical protein DL768_002180 [Monosporascus sp. mg162]|nr:hypothetical protein DL768_002180 [Monosporascus sp. mg162]